MTRMDSKQDWLTLYREAVREQDPKQLRVRIAEAQYAIQCRARELWYARTPHTSERRRMDAASSLLGILCTIGAEK